MEYLTAKQFSIIWEISERRIIKLCKEGRISGARKNGMVWEIPKGTLKPSDKRSNIYKYINIEKRIMIVNCIKETKDYLLGLLTKQGYIVEFKNINEIKNNLNNIEKYYEGLIYFSNDIDRKTEELFIKEFSKKLNFESSIVIVGNKTRKNYAETLKEEIGLRINSLVLDINKNDIDIDYDEIAEDIVNLLINFKSTTGISITVYGGKIELDRNKKTKNLESGEFYRAINKYFKKLNKTSYLWCASTMLKDEWTEDPQEMKFRLINLDVANRGVKIDRIFIFRKNKIKEFKNNKTLKIFMQSNINTMFVDYDEILEKNPKLLKIVGAGFDGIDTNTLIVDLPEQEKGRGYISKNTKEITKAYDCFQELKKYSKNLKEILK